MPHAVVRTIAVFRVPPRHAFVADAFATLLMPLAATMPYYDIDIFHAMRCFRYFH